jgi:Domain of unknown function (DUF4253)
MAAARLPKDGELRIGAVVLPVGERVYARDRTDPVAWVTGQPVLDIPRAWAMLTDAHEQTGLVPVLIVSKDSQTARPWNGGELLRPPGIAGLDLLDATAVLTKMWDDSLPSAEEYDEQDAADRAPFSRQFPGLAPRQDQELSTTARGRAIASLPASYLALVPASRPADVPVQVGWQPSDTFDDARPIAAVLRSWEDRFGARLLEMGAADIRLLVDRPPRTRQAAEAIAAEHFAFATESGTGSGTISSIAAGLIDQPLWSFWWD